MKFIQTGGKIKDVLGGLAFNKLEEELLESSPMVKLNYNRIKSRRAKKEVSKNSALHQARTCYSHLAGVAGVKLFKFLVDEAWFAESASDKKMYFELTPKGNIQLRLKHVEVLKRSQMVGYACPDWTDIGYHLGGKLGKVIIDEMISNGVAIRNLDRSVNLVVSIESWLENN